MIKMKIALISLMLLVSSNSFAQAIAESYTVQDVTTITQATITQTTIIGGSIYGQTEDWTPNITIFNASNSLSDTLWLGTNWKGATITIDSFKVSCDVDDQDINLVKKFWDGDSSRTEMEDFVVATNGTDTYYHTETSVTDGELKNGFMMGLVKPSVASTQITIMPFGTYTKAE